MENNLTNLITNLDNKLSNKFSTIIKANSTKSVFVINFIEPIQLNPSLNYELGMMWFSTYNSIYNIGAYTFEHSDDGIVFVKKTMIPGAYEIVGIGEQMSSLISNGKNQKPSTPNDGTVIKDLVLKPQVNFGRCSMTTTKHIRFSKELAERLGFTSNKIYPPGNYMGENIPNLSSVSDINIECDLVKGAYQNGKATNILYSFPANTVPSGYKLLERMNPPIYMHINRNFISTIEIKIVDQNGNVIDLNGEEVSISMHLKQA